MQCERLIKLIKTWYIHVKDETMAPARMVSFMEQHIETCEICQADPDVKAEVNKITELILPESKIPKAVRQQNSKQEEDEDDIDDEDNEDEDNDDIDDEDEEELDIGDD